MKIPGDGVSHNFASVVSYPNGTSWIATCEAPLGVSEGLWGHGLARLEWRIWRFSAGRRWHGAFDTPNGRTHATTIDPYGQTKPSRYVTYGIIKPCDGAGR